MRIPAPSFQDVPNARALPTPYASPAGATPDAFGADVGEAIQGAAQGFGEIYHREKRKADESAATKALAQGQTALTDIVDDPVKGYVSLKGMDALAGRDKALEDLDKRIAEINASLNPEQQRLFQHPATMLRNEAQHRIASHEAQQVNIADLANTKGAADAISRSLQTPAIASDPSAVATNMAKLQGVLESAARRQFGTGATPEALQSVVGPGMQRGAMDAMNGAMATENPDIAIGTFQRVSQYLGEHEHTYGNFVRGLATKQQVATESAKVIAAGAQKVAMPDGTVIPRVDGSKTAQALANLPPETPNLAEIEKAADTRKRVLDDLWSKSVAVIADRVHTAGQNPITGEFDLQGRDISPKDKAWLRAFAPGELDKLKLLDTRSQRRDNAIDRLNSAGNYSEALSALYDPGQKQDFQAMTMEQFQSHLLDEKAYPGGFTPQDRGKLVKQFALLQKQNFDEKVGATVKEELRKAFSGETDEQDKRFGTLVDRANSFVRQYQLDNGKTPKTEEVRAYVVQQLAQEPGSGWFGSNIAAKRRIDIPVKAATPVAPAGGPVRIRTPKGAIKLVPQEQLDEALKAGATVAP